MSSSSSEVSVPDLRSWLLPTTELLTDPYAALGIANHESDMWKTHVRIELSSETSAIVIITMKGRGGTDRLRLDLVQLPEEDLLLRYLK